MNEPIEEVNNLLSKEECWAAVSAVLKNVGITNPDEFKSEYTDCLNLEVQRCLHKFNQVNDGLPESIDEWKDLVLEFPYGPYGGWSLESLHSLYEKALQAERQHVREEGYYLVHEDGAKISLGEVQSNLHDLVNDNMDISGRVRRYHFDEILNEALMKSIFLKYREYVYAHGSEPSQFDWEPEILEKVPEVADALDHLKALSMYW